MQKKSLTELEYVVLGSVEIYGPCTAYRIREIFRGALSNHWKCSSGSIYPIIQRLKQRSMLSETAAATGQRPHKLISITSAGKKHFRQWMVSENIDPADLVNFDPLRARVRFLQLLSKSDRDCFFANTMAALREQINTISDYLRAKELDSEVDELQIIVIKQGRRDLRSQLRWLKEVEELLA